MAKVHRLRLVRNRRRHWKVSAKSWLLPKEMIKRINEFPSVYDEPFAFQPSRAVAPQLPIPSFAIHPVSGVNGLDYVYIHAFYTRHKMTEYQLKRMKALLAEHGQEHLLQFWDHLDEKQQGELIADIDYVDVARCAAAFSNVMLPNKNADDLDSLLEPVATDQFGSVARSSPEQLAAYRQAGLEAISRGEVAALLLAGGQGTRLGVPYPKGMYDVGLPSGKTLYQLQGERLKRLEHLVEKQTGRAGCSIPWYIMTSEHTRNPTLEFFANHDFFGLNQDNFIVFEQNMMPSFTFDGKIILEKTYRLALSPDGNGGLYNVLYKRGILEDMVRRGIKYIHAYCVDNILVKIADPTFIGFCISKDADCAAKVVEKASPTEAVGVVCKVRGRYQVVEYSEISAETAQKRNLDGRLTFNAGNICNHFFTLDFLNKVSGMAACMRKIDINGNEEDTSKAALKYHVAKKKIPFIDAMGVSRQPEKPNGVKLEMFVFDVFEYANSFAVWEVLREDEFSPLKNADGAEKDTPTTCRYHLFDLHHRYVLNSGGNFIDENGTPLALIPAQITNGTIKRERDTHEPIICEISPLLSYDGEDLEEIVKGQKFRAPLYLSENFKNGTH
ncbi:UDP-N-acetylhexosamine pyrophosphorylase-like isoform X5 [Varroa jacobsoni]|nr:UDP-N-acetylhexosamine pyrophosphorylase-like isoform X5 [Varroa jacobsoni]